MDSPDKSQRIIVGDLQESPFYKYLCDLSPIKPARRVHVAQTYSELSLPPPPAVFSSPPPNSQKAASRLRSGYSLAKTSGASGAEPGWDDKNRPSSPGSFNGKPSHANTDALYTRHPRGYVSSSRPPPDQSLGALNNGAGATGYMGSPSRAEAGDVELYLADPADGGLYAVRSSEMRNRTSSASALTSSLPIGSSSEDRDKCQEMVSPASDGHEKQDGHDDVHNDGACEANDTCGSQRFQARTSEELSMMLDELTARHAEESTSSDVLTLGQSPGPGAIVCAVGDSGASGVGVSMGVDDEASDFSFLTGAQDGESHSKLVHTWSEDVAEMVVSRFPQRRTSVYPTNPLGPEAIQEHEQKMQIQVSDFVASNSKRPVDASQDNMAHEGMRYGNLHQDKEHVQQQEVQPNCRAGVTGQRGIRRRCLDFEAAEARRKSMGSSASRKCTSSRAREVASGASYLASGASIPPQVLSDRAGSQSDATNSGRCSPPETDNQAHGPGPGRMDLQVSNKVVTSGMMRMSRCSLSKNKEEQSIVEPLRDALTSPMSISIPSGIGLHLNSLAGSSLSFSPSRGFNCSMGMSTASLLGLTPMSALKEDPTDAFESLTTPGVSGGSVSLVSSAAFASASSLSVVEITREEQQDIKVNEASIVGNLTSTTCFRSLTLGVKSVQSRYSLEEATERRGSPKRLLPHQELLRPNDLDLSEEFFESPRSPKKRRKSAAVGEKSTEGCRRCNCKKSKCLKLYCECFAAGIYCVGSCTCQDCFNKPEYGDKVLETRQLIESRNPLAFAPKIVHGKDTSPTSAEEFTDTPASARHKRGCNCKKSLCLKKYCECFQAGVGCSEGCRCEGCQNVYGKKEVFSEEQEEHMSQEGRDESEVQENHSLGRQPRSSSRVRAAAAKKRGMKEAAAAAVGTPLPLKSRSPVKPPRLSRSSNPRSSAGSVRSLGPSQQQQMSRPSPQMPMSSPNHVSTPVGKSRIAMLSPRWDGLGDICTLTPLPQPPLRPTPASVSTLDNRCGASPSFHRQCAELASSYSGSGASGVEESSPAMKHPDSQSSPAARCASNVTTASASHFQSPLPQTSPVSTHPTPPTPSLSSSQNTSSLPGKTFSNAGVVPAYLSFDSAEDLDTPEILRYSDVAQSPQVLTKTSSPKQIKRVSPPHYDGMGKHSERGSGPGSGSRNRVVMSPGPSTNAGTGSGSPGLSSGRKYILQALPSFPSMTPFSSMRGALQQWLMH